MSGFFGGGGGGAGDLDGGPVYAAHFEKFWFDESGSYLNYNDGITVIQSSSDVIYDDSVSGLDGWRLAPGMYLANIKMQYEAAGGTGALVGGVCMSFVNVLLQLHGSSSNTGHRYIWQTQPIPANFNNSQAAICVSGLIFSTDQATQSLYLASDWNWGDVGGGISQGLEGFILFKRLSNEQVTLVDPP